MAAARQLPGVRATNNGMLCVPVSDAARGFRAGTIEKYRFLALACIIIGVADWLLNRQETTSAGLSFEGR